MPSPPQTPPVPETESQSLPPQPDPCKLTPYKEGCPDNKTPHHCVPDHCFKEPGKGGAYYPGAVEHADGLCVCVGGATKSTAQSGERIKRKDFAGPEDHHDALADHGRIHLKFDKLESDLGKNGQPKTSAKLGELEDAAAAVISEVTGCDEQDLKKQLRDHHQKKDLPADTKLRADPYGKATPPPRGQMGVTNMTAGGAPG